MTYTEDEVRELVWKAFSAGWVRSPIYPTRAYNSIDKIHDRFNLWVEGKQIFQPRPDDEIMSIKLTPANMHAVAEDTDWTLAELDELLREGFNQNRSVILRISGLQVLPPKG